MNPNRRKINPLTAKTDGLRQSVTLPKIQPNDYLELWKWTQRTFETIWNKVNRQEPPVPLGSTMVSWLTADQINQEWPNVFQLLDGKDLKPSTLLDLIGPTTLPTAQTYGKPVYLRIN